MPLLCSSARSSRRWILCIEVTAAESAFCTHSWAWNKYCRWTQGPEVHYNNMAAGSSMYCCHCQFCLSLKRESHTLTFTKKVTASLPSRRRWSYVKARYIICILVSFNSTSIKQGTHWPNLNLAVNSNRSFFCCMQSEYSCLWQVNDWRSHHWTKDAAVADGEATSCHIFDGELVVSSLHIISNGQNGQKSRSRVPSCLVPQLLARSRPWSCSRHCEQQGSRDPLVSRQPHWHQHSPCRQ